MWDKTDWVKAEEPGASVGVGSGGWACSDLDWTGLPWGKAEKPPTPHGWLQNHCPTVPGPPNSLFYPRTSRDMPTEASCQLAPLPSVGSMWYPPPWPQDIIAASCL